MSGTNKTEYFFKGNTTVSLSKRHEPRYESQLSHFFNFKMVTELLLQKDIINMKLYACKQQQNGKLQKSLKIIISHIFSFCM